MQSVEGMKVICHELTQATSDAESSVVEDLVHEADKLVSCLAVMVITDLLYSWRNIFENFFLWIGFVLFIYNRGCCYYDRFQHHLTSAFLGHPRGLANMSSTL